MLTMGVLAAVAVKALVMKPEVLTQTRTIVLPNDTLVTLRIEIAELRGQYKVLEATAAARLETIQALTGPVQHISDTLLALQRLTESANCAQRLAAEQDRADRADRYQALKASADRVEHLQQQVPDYFIALEQNVAAIIHRPPDTVRLPAMRRRGLLNRLFLR